MSSTEYLISPDILKNAIQNNEFVLYFQPQFNVETASFDSVEALARWQHPVKGLLLPDDFIPAIEFAKLMPIFGKHILTMVSHCYSAWQKKGLPAFRMAVNVSWSELDEDDFLGFIKKVKMDGGFAEDRLELEFTENIVLYLSEDKMLTMAHELKKLGLVLTLDDFGTGYASIGHLKLIPFNRIKIDKSYVENIHNESKDLAIVRAILALGESLNLHVMAEGVESQKQMQILSSEGCKEMQGYYFSKPLALEELENFMLFYQNNTFL